MYNALLWIMWNVTKHQNCTIRGNRTLTHTKKRYKQRIRSQIGSDTCSHTPATTISVFFKRMNHVRCVQMKLKTTKNRIRLEWMKNRECERKTAERSAVEIFKMKKTTFLLGKLESMKLTNIWFHFMLIYCLTFLFLCTRIHRWIIFNCHSHHNELRSLL